MHLLDFQKFGTKPKAYRYNLVLVANQNLKIEDFESIGRITEQLDPHLKSFVLKPSGNDPATFLEIGQRPTFVFSPREIPASLFPRGKIYSGKYIRKDQQLATLRQNGILVPRSTTVRQGSTFTSEDWGDIVVVKPMHGSFSRGVQVMRPEDVSYEKLSEALKDKPTNSEVFLLQEFIDTGEFRPQHRVLTLFGEVLYGERISAENSLPTPGVITPETLRDFVITPVTVKRTRKFVYDEEILALARRVYRVFPQVPLQGVDIIRDVKSGKLYVLEFNPGGNTWHFSSKFGQHQRVEGKKRNEQFDAFKVAARVLAQRTRDEAI